jgi:hypothetical protein
MELQMLENAASLGRWKGLIKRGGRMQDPEAFSIA